MTPHDLRSRPRRRHQLLVALLVVLSPAAALAQFTPAFEATWNGSVSKVWGDHHNWSTSDQEDWYPGDLTHQDVWVHIPPQGTIPPENYPPRLAYIAPGGITIRALEIQATAQLEVQDHATLTIRFMGPQPGTPPALEPLLDCYGTLWAGPNTTRYEGAEVKLYGGQDVDDTTGIRLGGTGRIKLGDPAADSAVGRLIILDDGADINVSADAAGPGPRLIDGLGEIYNNEMEDGTKKFIIHDNVTVSGDMIISAPMDLHGGLILCETVVANTITLQTSAKSSGTPAHTGVYRVLDGDLIVGESTGDPAELMLVSGPAPWELDRGQIRIEAFADCRLISGPLVISGTDGGGEFYAFANWWTTKPATISVDCKILVNQPEPSLPSAVRVKGVTIGGPNQVTVTKIGDKTFGTY